MGQMSTDVGQPRRLRLLSAALLVGAVALWWLSGHVVTLLHAGAIPGLSDRVFRSRADYDLEFYLALVRTPRIIAVGSVAVVGVATMVLARAPRQFDRALVMLEAASAWIPRKRFSTVVFAGLVWAGLIIAIPYRAVGELSSDMVTYRVIANKFWGNGFAPGDLPLRDPELALLPYATVVRVLSEFVSDDGAFFLIYALSLLLVASGLYRVTTLGLGGGRRAGLLAAIFGTTLGLGRLGYGLSILHANPAPRMLATAVMLHALASLLARRLVSGVTLGLVATAVNTLDGLIPTVLVLLGLVFTPPMHGPRTETGGQSSARSAPRPRLIGAILIVGAVINALGPAIPGRFNFVILGVGTAIVVRSVLGAGLPSLVSIIHERRDAVAALGVAALAGIVLASLRTDGGSAASFFETLVLHETVLREVRNRDMLLLSSASIDAVIGLIGAAMIVVAGARYSSEPDGALDVYGSARISASRIAGSTVHAVLGFVLLGSLLLEWTTVPFAVTLWPIRTVWLVLPLAVAMLAVDVERECPRVGVLPVAGVAALLLSGAFLGSAFWGLLSLGAVVFVLGSHRTGVPHRYMSRALAWLQNREPVGRLTHLAVLSAAPGMVLVAVLLGSMPEIAVADSAQRILADGGSSAEIVEVARLARDRTPPEARILVPPNGEWGAFRLLSGRGVGFEFKQYSTSQPGVWYTHLRWMCDPGFELAEGEPFAIGLEDIVQCYSLLSADEIVDVARMFDTDFAVVRTELLNHFDVVAVTPSGSWGIVIIE